MTLRRVLNLAENYLLKDFTGTRRQEVVDSLCEPFDFELDEKARKRAERKRVAMQTGAYRSQTDLINALNLPTGRRR